MSLTLALFFIVICGLIAYFCLYDEIKSAVLSPQGGAAPTVHQLLLAFFCFTASAELTYKISNTSFFVEFYQLLRKILSGSNFPAFAQESSAGAGASTLIFRNLLFIFCYNLIFPLHGVGKKVSNCFLPIHQSPFITSLTRSFLWAIFAFCFSQLAWEFFSIWFRVNGSGPELQGIESLKSSARYTLPYLLSGIGLVFLAPAAEELLFRGLFQNWLRGKVGGLFSILLSTALFTAMHYNFQVHPSAQVAILASIASLSLLTGLIYSKYGNLLYPFALHSLFNLASWVMVGLQ